MGGQQSNFYDHSSFPPSNNINFQPSQIAYGQHEHKTSTQIFLLNCQLQENSPQKQHRQQNLSKNTKCTGIPSTITNQNILEQSPTSISYMYSKTGHQNSAYPTLTNKLLIGNPHMLPYKPFNPENTHQQVSKRDTFDSVSFSDEFIHYSESLQSIEMQKKISNQGGGVKIKVSSIFKNKENKVQPSRYKESLFLSQEMQVRKVIQTHNNQRVKAQNTQHKEQKYQDNCSFSCWPTLFNDGKNRRIGDKSGKNRACCQIVFDDTHPQDGQEAQINNYINNKKIRKV